MKCLSFFIFFCLLIFLLIVEFSFASDSITPGQSITDGETLVSSFRSFVLGFFSPVDYSDNRYLGIWYENSPRTVVWVANRNKPITDKTGVLTLSNNGSLLLLNQEKSIIWYSNSTSVAENPVAQLLDSGNLVLRDNFSRSSENFTWQSFDYPSDTLLPGMKLGRNLKTGFERYLTPWRSAEDPAPGDVSIRLDISGLPELIIVTGSRKEARSGPWNGVKFEGIPRVKNLIFIPMLVHTDDEIFFTFKPYSDKVITRLLLNQLGTLQRLVWNESRTDWYVLYSWPFDVCDKYAQCGANGNCRSSKTPICECLTGFKSTSQEDWDSPDSRKCVRKPSDCPSGEGFLKLPRMKLPENYWVNKSMNLKECEAQCTKNCSCRAYANSDITGGGSGCLMWFGDLVDIRECTEGYIWGQDIFIRVPAELASSNSLNTKKRLKIIIVVSIIAGMFILGLLLCIAWKKTKHKGMESWKEDIEVPLYDLATIAAATNHFSEANMIGKGGFGPVYKGKLSMGLEIAVKRLSKNSGQGLEEFMNEVVLIGKLQHRNLVGLLGSCIEDDERMLIYEYMPHKSLDYFIFELLELADRERSKLLPWDKRYAIIIGIARGLLYLHQDSKLQVIHRDLKASNILLDIDLNPKISDFGLARIFGGHDQEAKTERVAGTHGYLSPEYATDGIFSMKSDVFSLGVLLLEIVTGKRNRGFRHPAHHHNLIGHAWLLWNDGRAQELMDYAYLEDYFIESQVLRCIQVGLLCVQKIPDDRPDMSSVVFLLANKGIALPQPRQPGFFTETGVILTPGKCHSENALSITIPSGR